MNCLRMVRFFVGIIVLVFSHSADAVTPFPLKKCSQSLLEIYWGDYCCCYCQQSAVPISSRISASLSHHLFEGHVNGTSLHLRTGAGTHAHVSAVGPSNAPIPCSSLIAKRGGNAGTSILVWLGWFCAELMIRLITQLFSILLSSWIIPWILWKNLTESPWKCQL